MEPDELLRQLRDPLKPQGELRTLCLSAAEKIDWLYDLLRGRDNFIVSEGLWSKFTDSLSR